MVLDTLTPAERVAFVLHDMFAVPFDEIAPIVGRSPNAAKMLASRARHRVQGAAPAPDAELARQREVVDAFFAAARDGDFAALLAVLDPDVVLRADRAAVDAGAPAEVRGVESPDLTGYKTTHFETRMLSSEPAPAPLANADGSPTLEGGKCVHVSASSA